MAATLHVASTNSNVNSNNNTVATAITGATIAATAITAPTTAAPLTAPAALLATITIMAQPHCTLTRRTSAKACASRSGTKNQAINYEGFFPRNSVCSAGILRRENNLKNA